jgi:hypothetical protein
MSSLIDGGTLIRATLQLTISENGENWGPSGRAVDLHRLAHTWTEAGATWNCAIDQNASNSQPDCAGAQEWTMNGSEPPAFDSNVSATVSISNGQAGIVSLDVTDDVQSFLTGARANNGWILKKRDEGLAGRVEFSSRESSAAPRLLLEYAPWWSGRWNAVISGNDVELDVWPGPAGILAAGSFAGFDRELLPVLGLVSGPERELYLYRAADHATMGLMRDANGVVRFEYWETAPSAPFAGCARTSPALRVSTSPVSIDPGAPYPEDIYATDFIGEWSGTISGNDFTLTVAGVDGTATMQFGGSPESLVTLGIQPGTPRTLVMYRAADHATVSLYRVGSDMLLDYWESGCAETVTVAPN